MSEHAGEAVRDRSRIAEVIGDAVGAEAREQDVVTRWIVGLAPDHDGVVGERARVGVAVARLVDEHAVEEQLDADVRDGAARTAGAASLVEQRVELAHQAGDDGQLVERRVGGVVQRDAGRDVGAVRAVLRDPRARHRGEVRQHRAEEDARTLRRPAGDRGMAEEVHDF